MCDTRVMSKNDEVIEIIRNRLRSANERMAQIGLTESLEAEASLLGDVLGLLESRRGSADYIEARSRMQTVASARRIANAVSDL